ncbi:uncharacterized protein OCT59_002503 [Rhizophagus irregularis]|uniref:G-protein coupled receptors family 1 profile domain-containing protein n=2 Tax=Rhizophagus irregularis TaxID=588596 RepID=A0A916E3V1_9GLOM|nr:hypothetical protein OCT59_002503 [Rhizophagus irregularis]CAB4495426.1 unnamed protein product [Rhizophagus irregularis]CAB5357167.1 unnamed protein product [Rhizophagus irregularis]
MKVFKNNGRVIIANLIILILEIFHVEAFYLVDINDNLNNNLSKLNVNNINNNKNFNLISRRQVNEHYSDKNVENLPFKSQYGFIIVMISSFLAVYLNFVGTSYVLYRSYYKWKSSRRITLPMTLRVPMYIAMTDSFVMISHLINISRMAATQKPWEGSTCNIIGGLTFFFQCMNIFLVGGVAITTFLRVKSRSFSLGKYDYKLFLGMLILSLISTIALNKDFGQNMYWCAGKFDDKNLSIFSLCIIIIVMTVSLFCYISIIYEMRSIKIEEGFGSEEISNQRKEKNKRIYSKISSYILIFIIQYVPVTIYNISHIRHIDHYWIYVVCDIGINFGGIGNFVQYTINEGWSDKLDESSDTYNLNVINPRIPFNLNNNNNNSRDSNQDSCEVIDSFGIIHSASANQKKNKKVSRPSYLKKIPNELNNN